MKLLVTVVLMLVIATLVADASSSSHHSRRPRIYRRFNRRVQVIKHRSKSSSSSTNERRCHILCQKNPLRPFLIEKICPDLCDIVVCQNGGTCNDGVCTCAEGFEGQFCSDINECTYGPCDLDAQCTNNPGSFDCNCNNGFTGNGTTCTDIDECTNVPCDGNATCTNNPGSFDCNCNDGFSGNGTTCRVRECSDSGITVNIDQVNDEAIIEQVTGNNICRSSCISNPMCITYAIVNGGSLSNFCALFSINVTTASPFVPADEVTTGICTCPTGTTCEERVCTEFPGTTFLISEAVAASFINQFELFPVCRTRCRVNPLCNSFAFNIASNTCGLLSIDVTEPSLGLGTDGVTVVNVCE